MKVVVIGGTGLIGSKLVAELREKRHEAIAAAPETGVNTLTRAGLDEALAGSSVVVDVSNSRSFDEETATNFFTTSTRNLLDAEHRARVKHHVALSVVGTDRLLESGYFRAKLAQERLIQQSGTPYSIVHATQFFEFVKMIAGFSMHDDNVYLPPVLVQPMAADDVAAALCSVALGAPLDGVLEVGGPGEMRLDAFVRQGLAASGDPRKVLADPRARYFGVRVTERTLVPEHDSQRGETTFEQWLARNAAKAA